ncbi:MAG: GAF domain-containing protein [Treponema sp.]|nr:GAF domain-containing protein [Treponema sp.]
MCDYNLMSKSLEALLEGENEIIPMLANASALLWQSVDRINWAGFYLIKKGELLLGPFQGKVACVHIQIGKGVCGTAVAQNKIMRISNVHEFAGHIACDSASLSEIVIPLHTKEGKVFGVLDIDSPDLNRFDEYDERGLKEYAEVLEKALGL